MKTVKVFFKNGDHLITEINGTNKEIENYYKIGKVFNLGGRFPDKQEDLLTKVSGLEFLNN